MTAAKQPAASLIDSLHWPLALAIIHAELGVAASFDPLPAAFATLLPAAALFGFLTLQVLIVWALLFVPFALTPWLRVGTDPRRPALIAALLTALAAAIVHQGSALHYSACAIIAAATLHTAGDAAYRRWLYRDAPRMVALLVTLGFPALWLLHFPLRDWGGRNTSAVALVLTLAFALTAQLAMRTAPTAATKLATVGLAAALAIPHLETLFIRNYSIAGQPAVASNLSQPDVILLVVDTLRADMLSTINPRAPATPHIDALAAQSIVFENAVSAAPWTLPSMNAIMTGVGPHHETVDMAFQPTDNPTLAETLHQAGYRTRAIVGNHLLRRPQTAVRGFDRVDTFAINPLGDTRAAKHLTHLFPQSFESGGATRHLTDEAIAWLSSTPAAGGDFLWLHYFDPHDPYSPPPGYLLDGRPQQSARKLFKDRSSDPALLRSLYRAEVRFVDDQIGRFLQALRAAGRFDSSLIILTSDHGEEFWEHGGQGHGGSLYQELLHVPLLIKPPQEIMERRVISYTPTQAIPAAVAELLDLERPANWNNAIAPILSGNTSPAPAPIVSGATLYGEFQWSVIVNDLKYIRRLQSQREELYNLRSDPGEERSLPLTNQPLVVRARSILERRLETRTLVKRSYATPDDQRRLQSLGYIQ